MIIDEIADDSIMLEDGTRLTFQKLGKILHEMNDPKTLALHPVCRKGTVKAQVAADAFEAAAQQFFRMSIMADALKDE